jgi:hypothetical protein
MAQYLIDRRRANAVLSDVQWVLERACQWQTKLATEHLDIERATDLVTSTCLHIAVRSRSYQLYFHRFADEFTIRSRRESGTETELSKIRRGFGDYLLYGFCEGFEHRFFKIIDLTVLRGALDRLGPDAFGVQRSNADGTFFYAFNERNFLSLGLPILFKWGAC